MAEESTARALSERVRGFFEALNRGDLDAVMSFHTAEAIWDASSTAAGTFVGAGAVRGFLADWQAAFDEWTGEPQELVELDRGVVFADVRWTGRPTGGAAAIQARGALVFVFASGMIARVVVYTRFGIDKGRATAERLAEERS